MDTSPDVRSLVRKARTGDETAFREIVRLFQSDVLHLAGRILRNKDDAEDAAQEVFVRLHRSLGQYDPERAFRSWLLRITHNLCIDHLRRRRMSTVSLDEPIQAGDGEIEWEIADPAGVDPLENLLEMEEKRLIEESIAELGPTLRSAITLRHVQGLRYDEIAEILGVPLGTVKVRIFRARAAMAEILGRKLGRDGS